MKVIAHRGWRTRHPDNTLAAISAARGVSDLIEIDVRRSSDGELVLSHDPILGGLVVCETPWAVLRELDLGDGEGPATLEEALAISAHTPLNLEVKNDPVEPGFEGDFAIADEVADLARPGDLLSSFHWPTVDHIRRSEIETGLLVDEGGSVDAAIEHAEAHGHRTIIPHDSLADHSTVDRLLKLGFEVVVWTINKPERIRELHRWGVAGVVTDDPGLARDVVDHLDEIAVSIKEELAEELKDSMRKGDAPRRAVIRQIETEMAMVRTEAGFSGQVDDDLYRSVIAAYVKKMDKARREFEAAGDRGKANADKLAYEIDYLSRWLPKKLDEAATAALVGQVITELGASNDPKKAGMVVGQILKTGRDDLDGALVNRLVRAALESG